VLTLAAVAVAARAQGPPPAPPVNLEQRVRDLEERVRQLQGQPSAAAEALPPLSPTAVERKKNGPETSEVLRLPKSEPADQDFDLLLGDGEAKKAAPFAGWRNGFYL